MRFFEFVEALIVGYMVVWMLETASKVVQEIQQARLDERGNEAAKWCKPFEYSDRHRLFLPIVRHIPGEFLGVRWIELYRNGSEVGVSFRLEWWARTRGYKRRLTERATELLKEGGATKVEASYE